MSFQSLTKNDLAHEEISEVLENGEILRDSPLVDLQAAPVPALDRYFWEWMDRRVGIFDRRAGTVEAYGGVAACAIATCRDTHTAEKIVAALNAGARG